MIDLAEITQIDYDYFEWLTEQIHIPNDKSYSELFERMHNLEFVWTVPNDDNRVQDGKDLRYEFLENRRGKLHLEFVTVLEVLVALSRRVAFTAGGEPRQWAWRLLKNLRLTKCCDPFDDRRATNVEEILENLVWRTYREDGQGGFFPLRQASEDQTKVEIWYQMNLFVNERQAL